jgi:hypothetical protein
MASTLTAVPVAAMVGVRDGAGVRFDAAACPADAGADARARSRGDDVMRALAGDDGAGFEPERVPLQRMRVPLAGGDRLGMASLRTASVARYCGACRRVRGPPTARLKYIYKSSISPKFMYHRVHNGRCAAHPFEVGEAPPGRRLGCGLKSVLARNCCGRDGIHKKERPPALPQAAQV